MFTKLKDGYFPHAYIVTEETSDNLTQIFHQQDTFISHLTDCKHFVNATKEQVTNQSHKYWHVSTDKHMFSPL